MSTAQYITGSGSLGTSNNVLSRLESYISLTGQADGAVFSVKKEAKIAPKFYFKYIKSKFGVLDGMRLKSRIKKLESAFDAAVANGQSAFGDKILEEVARESRESILFAKGYKMFIELEDINRFKRKIRGGHISDTRYDRFTRLIPKRVVDAKVKASPYFDGFVIYHVYNEEAEKKLITKQKMSDSEKADMRDPVLFGVIRETNRLYFIAEWADDHCDLSFDEMVDAIGKEDSEFTLSRFPVLKL